MPISTFEFEQMQARIAPKPKPGVERAKQASRETGKGGLQQEIQRYCQAQHPEWPIIQARTDQASTIAVGAHDMTIFASERRVICVETKARGKKVSQEQLIWAARLRRNGHTVHFVWSFEEFLNVVNPPKI